MPRVMNNPSKSSKPSKSIERFRATSIDSREGLYRYTDDGVKVLDPVVQAMIGGLGGRSIRKHPFGKISGGASFRRALLVANATPMEIIELERSGVQGTLIKDMSRQMEMPSSRLFTILGIPKATAEKKAAAGELVKGSGGQAAVGMMRLLCLAEEIAANSTASQAKGFDSAKWLGQWIERPQPALGGRKPADLIDTPTGVELVARLLGSLESGAYQ